MGSIVAAIPFFRGEYKSNESPTDWLKRLIMAAPPTWSDRQRIERFGVQCAGGSQAEEWFLTLDATMKASWDDFQDAFLKRWPPPVIERLRAITLDENDIGVLVEGENGQEWGHVHWATRVFHTAQTLGDVNCLLVDVVLENTPDIMRELIGDMFHTWTDFLTAVSNVSTSQLSRLKAKGTAEKELRDEVAQLKAHLQGLSLQSLTRPTQTMNIQPSSPAFRPTLGPMAYMLPTPAPRTAPSQSSTVPLPTPQPTFQTPAPNPFSQAATPMSRSNLFYRFQQPQTPSGPGRVSQVERLCLAAGYTNLPHHPTTEAGRQAYNKQVTDWLAQHGTETVPNTTRPFPLMPGTSPLGSRECFGCGTVTFPGHRSDDCPNPNLPAQEKWWREIVSGLVNRALRGNSLAPPGTPVQYVATTQYQSYYNAQSDPYQYAYIEPLPDSPFQGNRSGLQ
ncbi:hypothetical protein BU15DRAFT_68359 [Melanogaster broomeanus]|nr:hypothetical protein BU15DRAFT_68359 [Melanogaster broomeanus]